MLVLGNQCKTHVWHGGYHNILLLVFLYCCGCFVKHQGYFALTSREVGIIFADQTIGDKQSIEQNYFLSIEALWCRSN